MLYNVKSRMLTRLHLLNVPSCLLFVGYLFEIIMRKWCETEDICLGRLGYTWENRRAPTRIRCPKCKRRFKPFIRECGDLGCLHWYMSKHKTK